MNSEDIIDIADLDCIYLSYDEPQKEEFSPTFPLVPKTKLYEFLATAKEDEVRAEKNLRAWVVSQLAKNN